MWKDKRMVASVLGFTLSRIDETGLPSRELRVITQNVSMSPRLAREGSKTREAGGTGEEGGVEEPKSGRNCHESYLRADVAGVRE